MGVAAPAETPDAAADDEASSAKVRCPEASAAVEESSGASEAQADRLQALAAVAAAKAEVSAPAEVPGLATGT